MTSVPPSPAGRRVALLVNPAAGRHDPALIARLAARLATLGFAVETLVSRAPGDLAARLPGLAADVVAVAGGDGTVNEVVGALAGLAGVRPRLAVIPHGTANVLAHEYGLPGGDAAIAAMIAGGRTRPLCLGSARADGEAARPFFLMTSAGFDAEVVHAVEARAKQTFKKFAFLVTALRRGFRDRPKVAVTATRADGAGTTQFVCADAIVTNARHYGGPFVLTRRVAMDRPGLQLIALADDRPLALLGAALRLAFGRLEGSAKVVSLAVDHVRLASVDDRRLHVQIDGEPHGLTPVEVHVTDVALDLMVP